MTFESGLPAEIARDDAAVVKPASSNALLIYAGLGLLALTGGAFGIIGAIIQEMSSGGGLLLIFAGAPIIEECLKPAGVYIGLIRWPQLMSRQPFLALACAGAGLVFGLIESTIYVQFYVPDPTPDYIAFRYTVPVAMHTIASFIVGLGLSPLIIDWANGRTPFPKSTRNAFAAAMILHGGYNIAAVALEVSGVLSFD